MSSSPGSHTASSSSTTKETIVVTGATGYVGRQLIDNLCENHSLKYEVIALVRKEAQIATFDKDKMQVRVVDYSSLESIRHALKNANIIIHSAFNMDFFPADENQMEHENVTLTRNLIEVANDLSSASSTANEPLKFLFISSTEAIGYMNDLNKDGKYHPLNETSELNPTSKYGYCKVQCESLILKYASDHLKIIILRPTGIYGVNERFFFWEVLNFISAGLSFLLPSPMNGIIMFTHIHDVIQAILLSIDSSSNSSTSNSDVFIVCPDSEPDQCLTYRQVIECVSKELVTVPKPTIVLPVSLGKVVIRLLKPWFNWGKDRIFLYHERSVEETVRHRWYDNSKLKSAVGFVPHDTMQHGIQQVVRQEIANGTLRASVLARLLHRIF